nr:hypothetical protein [uncultured Psychroserpens sp.]
MKIILKRFLILIILSFGQILIGQNEVEFSINSEDFIKESEQTYMSANGEVFVVVETFNHKYEEIVADFESAKVENPDELSLEYFEDKQVFSAMIVEKYRDGRDFISLKLLKDLGNDTTLYLIVAFPVKKKDKYYPILIEAVKSAKLKE